MKITYQKIQEYITEPLPAIDVLREKIIFHAFEVESVEELGNNDWELDIKVLPDRAFDAKTEQGIAREVAALFTLNLKEPDQYDRGTSFNFSIQKVADLLGREISDANLKEVFDAYHYHYEINGDIVTFFIPPWRTDLNNVHDITDESGRYLGYDTVPALLPDLKKNSDNQNAEYIAIMNKKYEMIGQGYHEVMTYSLVKKGDYQVAKGPKGKDFLRTNLLDELRKAYEINKQNVELLPNYNAKLFEIGRVFLKTGEELHVAWIDEKGEHEEILSTETLSTLAERVDAEGGRVMSGEDQVRTEGAKFKTWSEYPFITRDIAVWVPESTDGAELVQIIKNNGTELLQGEPRLFDQFSKDGRTSYAYRMIFQSYERTLTGEEIDAIMKNIYQGIQEKKWEIR